MFTALDRAPPCAINFHSAIVDSRPITCSRQRQQARVGINLRVARGECIDAPACRGAAARKAKAARVAVCNDLPEHDLRKTPKFIDDASAISDTYYGALKPHWQYALVVPTRIDNMDV
jgi:hypothetical protein